VNYYLAWATLLLFGTATVALAVYGLHLYVLVFLFRRRRRQQRQTQQQIIANYAATPAGQWPVVTSQIPLYNERHVARRVIEAAAAMDYPAGRHEIQVLDDSTDACRGVVDGVVAELQARGCEVIVVRRPSREGYKAGALAMGLEEARGRYVAIFDADFVPPRNFLRKAVPLLEASPDLACLQGRWAHLNERESWLTRAQSLGIDGHFAIEQGARAWNGLLMNFNGTAGVWRKAAIEDATVGGWNGDTLTEDLDLSYRVQLAGWRIDYCIDLPCPAELPGTITALKTQQRRWATGSIQVACKLLPQIWKRSSALSLGQKLEATLHLTHYSVALWMLVLALIARPMLIVMAGEHEVIRDWFWVVWIGILFSAVAPSATYGYARYSLGGGWSGVRTIPSMLVLGMGLCVNNAVAVLRGLVLKGGEFVRTPKSGSESARRRVSAYRPVQDNLWIIELLLGIYSLISFGIYVLHFRWAFSIFLLLYAVGFLVIGWHSKPFALRLAGRGLPAAPTELSGPLDRADESADSVAAIG
jgi:cellulose synthase/poly-beta-1,6-N-acetylglucosamine synthase-like glycosyltransferase